MLSRDAYVARMEAQLTGWADELAWLRARTEQIAARGSVRFQRQLAAAQRAHGAVRHEFEGLKKSGEERWTALAAGVEDAWNELTA
jgi:hypothetical protein